MGSRGRRIFISGRVAESQPPGDRYPARTGPPPLSWPRPMDGRPGRAGACFSHPGPGADRTCHRRRPRPAHRGPHGLHFAPRAKQAELAGQVPAWSTSSCSMSRPITKKAVSTGREHDRSVFAGHSNGRGRASGHVHIEPPEDVAAEEVTAVIQKRGEVRRPSPDPMAVESAVSDPARPQSAPVVSSGAKSKADSPRTCSNSFAHARSRT